MIKCQRDAFNFPCLIPVPAVRNTNDGAMHFCSLLRRTHLCLQIWSLEQGMGPATMTTKYKWPWICTVRGSKMEHYEQNSAHKPWTCTLRPGRGRLDQAHGSLPGSCWAFAHVNSWVGYITTELPSPTLCLLPDKSIFTEPLEVLPFWRSGLENLDLVRKVHCKDRKK